MVPVSTPPPEYAERPSIVADAVLWQRRSTAGGQVLPDGCMDLLLTDDGIVIAGPDTEPYGVDGDGRRYLGLRFEPGRLPGLLGLKAAELRNRRVRLAELIGDGPARRIEEQVITADRPGRMLERYAIGLQLDHVRDRSVAAITTMINDGRTIGEIASRTGFGERRLHRLGLHYFGYGPKMLSRILRVQRALRLGSAGVPAAEVAQLAGYADQAHLIRETKRLTGDTFGHFGS